MSAMKKFKIALVALALILGGTYVYMSTAQCNLKGNNICFDSSTQTFGVEENARLSVQVENEALGAYLQATWTAAYPNTVLDIVVKPVLSLEELKTLPTDIMVADQKEAAFFMEHLLDMGRDMTTVVGSRIPQNLQDAMNLKGFFFAQNSVTGPLFVKNKTLMNSLGINDITNFDDLFNNKETILASLSTVLPISFLDQRSFYPYLTAGGWLLNPTHIGTDAGYGSEEFLKGLQFIESLGTQNLFGESIKAVDLPWNYELDFYSGNALVSIIEDRVFAAEHAALQGYDYIYSEFPMYENNRPAPRAEVRGYIVNKAVEYPSAAAEVIRILRSANAVNLNEVGVYAPIYHVNHLEELAFTGSDLDLIRAYTYSDAVSIIGVETDPTTLARAIYQEVDIMDILMNLYDGTLDAETAQAEIVERANLWYQAHGVEEPS